MDGFLKDWQIIVGLLVGISTLWIRQSNAKTVSAVNEKEQNMRLDEFEKRFERNDSRFEKIIDRLGNIEHDIAETKTDLEHLLKKNGVHK